jgi:hypothetical protein
MSTTNGPHHPKKFSRRILKLSLSNTPQIILHENEAGEDEESASHVDQVEIW